MGLRNLPRRVVWSTLGVEFNLGQIPADPLLPALRHSPILVDSFISSWRSIGITKTAASAATNYVTLSGGTVGCIGEAGIQLCR